MTSCGSNIRVAAGCLAALLMAFGTAVSAQQEPAGKKEIGKVPVPKTLAEHSNWFTPAKIYDLRKEHNPLQQYPEGLGYDVYSAVGYDLANTIVIVGPKKEIVIVDTLGNPGITKRVIEQLRDQKILPQGKLPIRAIIYTHNHIDHAYGVWGYLLEADRPPCQPADPEVAGPDKYLNVDTATPDCVTIIGQYNINDGVGTTATVDGTIIDARSLYMYGAAIPLNHVNDGIGPQEKGAVRIAKGDGTDGTDGERRDEIVSINPAYRMPSRTFNEEMTLTAAGVQMKLVYVPSETNDELSVFLPDGLNKGVTAEAADLSSAAWGGPGLLLSAEVIQGPAFPNLYSLRGTGYRNPATWFRSVDKLRTFDSWCMIPSHGPPLCEPSNIQRLLKNFRDAIQFTHDQTIRYMNKGYTMDELAPLIENLYLEGEHEIIMGNLDQVKPIQNTDTLRVVNPRDYLRPFYGSVVQAVRAIYVGSVGWFQADPVALRPTPPKQLARRYLSLMCGPSSANNSDDERAVACGAGRINSAAEQALRENQDEWAAELTTQVIRAYADVEHPDKRGPDVFETARQIKAQAFLKLAATETYGMNPNWRNWYITAAHELQGLPLPGNITGGLVSPGVVGALPAGAWVNSLTMRLRAEITAKNRVEKSLGFWFPAGEDKGNQGFGPVGYVLNIRGGIAELIEDTRSGEKLSKADVEKADLAIAIYKGALDALLYAEARGEAEFRQALRKAYDAKLIQPLNGTDIGKFTEAFLGFFDPKPVAVPALTVR